jgi:acyl transferase domain-containing protein/acyl carrier protein
MSGRFPGARNIEEFWQNLCNGVESITFFSDQELLDAGVDEKLLRHKDYVKAAGVLADADLFDAGFFGFSPRDAEVLSPQYRVFLECAWEALENAGYNTQTYEGLIGVYAGSAIPSYMFQNLLANPEVVRSVGKTQISLGNGSDFLTTYVSYKLNLRGPSMVIQSACSTSLVAVHVACQNLLNGECDIALAGGVAVHASQKKGYLYGEGGIASPDGHCRAFDADAKGTVGGSGVGIVVLKNLEDALKDGDHIHAVILGSALNNDGSLKIGYTAPGIEGQTSVIRDAIDAAGIDEESVTYIEGHGTGTPLGDPIEFAALQQAYGPSVKRKQFRALGSVKTNVGHLDATAGVAGLIKAVLSLEHGLIPPSLHFQKPNPNIDLANSSFYVNTTLRNWEKSSTPRRAGVSSFGMGGTNAHAILEEPPIQKTSSNSRQNQLIVLSARTSTALDAVAENLARFLKRNPETNLADVAYTLQTGRAIFSHRRALVTTGLSELVSSLESPAANVLAAVNEDSAKPVAFMFTGQGAQYVQMGHGLYQSERVFREQLDHCAEILIRHLQSDIREVLFSDEESASSRLNETWLTQPALFVIEYATAKLLLSWGIEPQAMIGHSIGEYVAATLAETLTLEDALLLVTRRGALMQSQPRGAMLSVLVSAEELRPHLGPGIDVAAINAPGSCVLSGREDDIQLTEQRLKELGYSYIRLSVSHAFHSDMMTPAVSPFEDVVRKIKLRRPKIPFISNVTGTWITDAQAADPHYWARHLRETVRFADGISALMQQDEYLLLEVGPGHTLCGLAERALAGQSCTILLPTLRQSKQAQSDSTFLLETLGQLWLAGAAIDWAGFYRDERRCRVPLPTYPFERQRYWLEPPQSNNGTQSHSRRLVKDDDLANWFYVPVWKRATSTVAARGNDEESWLLFVGDDNLSRQLIRKLSGRDVVLVKAGRQYERIGERAFVIDPRRREHYSRLFKELSQLRIVPANVIHLWNASSNETDLNTSYRGFYSLLFIAQSLGRDFPGATIRMCVVVNSIHDVTGDEEINAEGWMLLGPCKVIPQEYPNVVCQFFDVSGVADEQTELIECLLAQVPRDEAERVLAFRNGRRWVQVFERLRLQEATGTLQLRERGTYLITGGLGKLGLSVAESLAKNYAAKLILVSRSTVAEHNGRTDPLLEKIRSFAEFGSEVVVAQADVSNETEMRDVLARAGESFAHIDGVIHCAGLANQSARKTIQEITPAECENIFAAKVRGLVTLRKVLQDRPPKFVALMSSLSTVVGGLGFVAYASANLFMDGFATRWNGVDGVRWISVGWDGWRFSEEGSGDKTTRSDLAMNRKQGLEAFRRIMLNCRTLPQVAVSTADLQARIRQWITLESVSDQTQKESAQLHGRPVLKTGYVAPGNETETRIADIWQSLLGIQQIGVQDNFFDLGGHSLIAIQVMSRLRESFRIDVPLHSIFETPTISQLASAIRPGPQDQQVAQTRIVPRQVASIDEILLNLDRVGDVKAAV